jgi:hypothetical protein
LYAIGQVDFPLFKADIYGFCVNSLTFYLSKFWVSLKISIIWQNRVRKTSVYLGKNKLGASSCVQF